MNIAPLTVASLFAALAATSAVASPEHEHEHDLSGALIWEEGHGDLGPFMHDGVFELGFIFHDEEGEESHSHEEEGHDHHSEIPFGDYDADQIIVLIGEAAHQGGLQYILPRDETAELPFLGFSAEDVALLDGTQLAFTLGHVEFEGAGNGDFSLVDFGGTFGDQEIILLDEEGDSFNLAGDHAHYELRFDGEGLYEIELTASGTLADGSAASATATYFFQVPAPGAAGLIAVAGLAAARRRRA